MGGRRDTTPRRSLDFCSGSCCYALSVCSLFHSLDLYEPLGLMCFQELEPHFWVGRELHRSKAQTLRAHLLGRAGKASHPQAARSNGAFDTKQGITSSLENIVTLLTAGLRQADFPRPKNMSSLEIEAAGRPHKPSSL